MTNQTKRKKNNYNKTRKICSQPFTRIEEDYSTNTHFNQLKLINERNNKYVNNLKKKFILPSQIKAQNDFYSYINYNWLEKSKKSKNNNKDFDYITEIDNVRITQDKVYRELFVIIKKYIKSHNTPETRNLYKFVESAYNLNPISNSLKHIDEYINYLDELRQDKKNIWKLLAYINKIDIMKDKCPFVWSLEPDPSNNKIFIPQISPFIFETLLIYGMISISDYKKNLTKNNFSKHLKKLFSSYDKKFIKEYRNVISVILEIFNTLSCNGEAKMETDVIHTDDIFEKYNFNWDEFARELGYKDIPKKILCKNTTYLKCGTKLLLDNWDSEKWRSFWIWIYIRAISRFTKNWSSIYYEYYGKTLKGEIAETPPDIRCTQFTCVVFNKLINNLYLEQYNDPIKADFVKNLAEDLKVVFKRIIGRNVWMAKTTKKYALEKLDALQFLLIKPPQFADDPPCTICYKSNELFSNLIKYSQWRTNFFILITGEKVRPYPNVAWSIYPVTFISYQSFIVNAAYIPSINSMYIPSAYIQKPFVDLDNKTLSYNLATIGFTIAHELSHALDNKGSKYDKKGNLLDWWTPEDKKKYKLIQESIIKQYDEWAKRDGLDYNAAKTIGEDIADISGLSICDEFLRDYVTKNHNDVIPAQLAYYELFYIHYAVNLRQKLVNEESQLITNPHPPDKYRCNVPLSRSNLFRAVYDVKKGDKMWWPSTNQIW